MATVSSSIGPSEDIRAKAAATFSRPNILDIKAWSFIRGESSRILSAKDSDWSVRVSTDTPAAASSSCTSAGRKRPCISVVITLRRATPPSEPFFPALSSIWMAALVSSNETPAVLATIPACSSAAAMAGSSAEPACPAAAMTFIMRAISSEALAGSARDTWYWFMAVVSTEAAAAVSLPISFEVVLMLSPIEARASGTCAISGPSWERTSL